MSEENISRADKMEALVNDNLNYIRFNSSISNRVNEDVFSFIKKSVLKEMSDVVSTTLGPYGKEVMIFTTDNSGYTKAYSTKDGFTAIKSTKFGDLIPEWLSGLVRDVSFHMQKKVGDGTTSGIPILENLYSNLYEKIISNPDIKISPVGLSNILEEIKNIINEEIFEKENPKYIKSMSSMDIDEKKSLINRVGNIAANNNFDIGERIANMYHDALESGRIPAIDITIGFGDEDEIIDDKGFEIDGGIESTAFGTEFEDANVCNLIKPKILAFKGNLYKEDLDALGRIILATLECKMDKIELPYEKSPLVIIANSFAPEVSNMLEKVANGTAAAIQDQFGNVSLRKMPVAALRIVHMSSDEAMERYDIICTALGITPIDVTKSREFVEWTKNANDFHLHINENMGRCDRFLSNRLLTKFFDPKRDEEKIVKVTEVVEKAIEMALTPQESLEPDTGEIGRLYNLLTILSSRMTKIKVGALSFREKTTKATVYEDIVLAIKSTIEAGSAMLGGNVSIPHFIHHNIDNISDTVMNRLEVRGKNVMMDGGGNGEVMKKYINTILDIMKESFTASYEIALMNAIADTSVVKSIIEKSIFDDPEVCSNFNMIKNTYEQLSHEDVGLIVPGNTDKELLDIIITTIKQLNTTAQLLTATPLNVDINDFWGKGLVKR